jgi:hypothetical protein
MSKRASEHMGGDTPKFSRQSAAVFSESTPTIMTERPYTRSGTFEFVTCCCYMCTMGLGIPFQAQLSESIDASPPFWGSAIMGAMGAMAFLHGPPVQDWLEAICWEGCFALDLCMLRRHIEMMIQMQIL